MSASLAKIIPPINNHLSGMPSISLPRTEGELWTARQRQMHSLHYAISYRASFKPELPDFFIERYLIKKNIHHAMVLDPFGGRGTSCIQANLRGFTAIHNDINPISAFLAKARKNIPPLPRLMRRVKALPLKKTFLLSNEEKKRFLPFFHKRTLSEILNLRELLSRASLYSDPELTYIGLTALSRLHGHSNGFLSVYSFPQISISPIAQARNNLLRQQKPEYRPIKPRIIRKLQSDLRMPLPPYFHEVARQNQYLNEDAQTLPSLPDDFIDLIVTSPPFLDKVQYQNDNWMRSWFLGMEKKANASPVTVLSKLDEWSLFMKKVMFTMGRVLKKRAYAVIEVGEVCIGKKQTGETFPLEVELLRHLPLTLPDKSKLQAKEIFINRQHFTKLSHCWSVANNQKGTNTNRCLVLQKL